MTLDLILFDHVVVFCWNLFRHGASATTGRSVAAQTCLTVAEEAFKPADGTSISLNYSVINGSGGRLLETT